MDAIVNLLNSRQVLLSIFVAIAVVATILSLGMPLLHTDSFAKRMKSVSTERERIRQRERERLAARQSISLRQEPKAYMKQIVESFSLSKWLGTEKAKSQLAMAGYRGPQAEIAFLFFRLVVPIVLFLAAMFYIVVLDDSDWPLLIKFGGAIFASYIGIKAPELFLKNTTSKRQASMRRSFPDAMDLLLICVESGMSIEHAFRKVSQEIGVQSVPLAEEFTLATAELAYLPDRRQAFENLGTRTGVESIQQISTVLIQGGEIWYTAWDGVARRCAGKPRGADEHGGKESPFAAAEAHRADDSLLSAGSVRRDHHSGHHSGDGDSVNSSER